MTIHDLIERTRAQINANILARNDLSRQVNERREAADYTTGDEREAALLAQRTELDTARSELESRLTRYEADAAEEQRLDALSNQVTTLPPIGGDSARQAASVSVGAEPHTYSRGTAHEVSFFADMFNSQFRNDVGARQRLERHAVEARVDGGQQARALATGGLAGLVPPQYLVDQYAMVARAGRPTANVVAKMPLPDQGMNLYIPRGTTGASAAVQASENGAVSTTDQVWSNVTVPVATIAGYAPLSRQAIERAAVGTDEVVFADVAGAYAVALNQQVLSGSGAAGQMLGILNTGSINQASAFTAAATVQTFYSKLAGQINAVETTRFMAPDLIIMHPRRWNWLLTQLDTSNRPLVIPKENGNFNSLGVANEPLDTHLSTPVGSLFGLPVITDASIPTNVGTGPEDQVIVCRRSDLILFEDGDGSPQTLTFEQTAGSSLTVTLVAYGYAAFTAGRYPTAVGVVGGNAGTAGYGLINPTF